MMSFLADRSSAQLQLDDHRLSPIIGPPLVETETILTQPYLIYIVSIINKLYVRIENVQMYKVTFSSRKVVLKSCVEILHITIATGCTYISSICREDTCLTTTS